MPAGACALVAIVVILVFAGSSFNQAAFKPLHFEWLLKRDGAERVALTVPASFLGMGGGAELIRLEPMEANAQPGLQTSLLINMLWPEMTGRTRQNSTDFEVRGGGRAMMIFVESGAIDDFHGVKFDALKLHEKIAQDFLENVCIPTGLPMPKNVECVHRPAGIDRENYGLRLYGRDYALYPVLPTNVGSVHDVLEAQGVDGNLSTLITCNPDGLQYPTPFSPSCTQVFMHAQLNALVQVTYRKEYLPEWKKIQANTSELLSSFAQEDSKIKGNKGYWGQILPFAPAFPRHSQFVVGPVSRAHIWRNSV